MDSTTNQIPLKITRREVSEELDCDKSEKWQIQMVAKKKKPLELKTMNVANEINLDAAGVSDFYGIFTLKDKHKNGTEGFSQWTTLLCFTPYSLEF